MNHKPRLQALVLAERIYTDHPSGNKIIAGTYNTLFMRQIPGQSDTPAWLFISLTDVRNELPLLEIRYVDLSDLSVLMEAKTKVAQRVDPMHTMEVVLALPGLPVPHAGAFDLELHVDGHKLGAHRVTVKSIT